MKGKRDFLVRCLLLALLSALFVACQTGAEATTEVAGTTEATEAPTTQAPVTDAPTTEPPPPTDAPTAVSTEPVRTVSVQSVQGTVEIRLAAGGAYEAASEGQVLGVGAEVRTGGDGRATLLLDDGTQIVVIENSSFTVTALEGTPSNPISRFFLNLGKVFSISQGELPPGASYEVETPNGVAAIRGSMLSVGYDPISGEVVVTCLIGHCVFSDGITIVDLEAGQAVSIAGLDLPMGEVILISDEQFQEWLDILGLLGIDVVIEPIEPTPPDVPPDSPTTEVPTVPPAPVCGDGLCDVAAENSDICPQDCQCFDNGVCEPGEGLSCLDCGDMAGGCGAPCSNSSQCSGGLTCAPEGVCWEPCACAGKCGGPKCAGYCGDYICDSECGETAQSCSIDCGGY